VRGAEAAATGFAMDKAHRRSHHSDSDDDDDEDSEEESKTTEQTGVCKTEGTEAAVKETKAEQPDAIKEVS